MPFFAYIVECADGSLYTGWTDDIERRIAAHNAGKGARYTRSRLPVRLLNHWQFGSKGEAMSFEWHVKQMSRKEKLDLVAGCSAPSHIACRINPPRLSLQPD
ncbi:MAG TPA: GIY-YIG nuclease family protein [Candidatus Obscuribacterales bacterium]